MKVIRMHINGTSYCWVRANLWEQLFIDRKCRMGRTGARRSLCLAARLRDAQYVVVPRSSQKALSG
jgi:hypothetical protein